MSNSRFETENYSTSIVENSSLPISIDNETFYSTQDSNIEYDNHVSYNPANYWKEIYERSSSTSAHDQLVNQHVAENLNSEHIQHPNNNRITYQQDIAIRYLQPPTPPPSGPIIVREIHAPQPSEPAPLVIHQRAHAPLTPPPIVLRERPPVPPPVEPPQIVYKYIRAPPPHPQRLIIEREASLPRKPPPIIIEKWLPYKSRRQRDVIIERAQPLPAKSSQKNTIITYDVPAIDLVRNVRYLGTVRVDPLTYYNQYGAHLVTTEYIQDAMASLGIENNCITMLTKPNAFISNNNQFQTIDQLSMAYEEYDQSNAYQAQNDDIETDSEELFNLASGDTHQIEILSDENIYN